jgi:hypothetical protein
VFVFAEFLKTFQPASGWIKGHNFTIGQLLMSDDLGKPWSNRAIASYRLRPQDYHRFHAPVDGVVKWCKPIGGSYYAVDPITLMSKVNVLDPTRERRSASRARSLGRYCSSLLVQKKWEQSSESLADPHNSVTVQDV